METKMGDIEGLGQTSSKAIQKETGAEDIKNEALLEKSDPASGPKSPTAPAADISASKSEDKPVGKEETSKPKDAVPAEEVPDPDEDDLDDLDDMLDEFAPSKPEPTPISGPGRPGTKSTAITDLPFPRA